MAYPLPQSIKYPLRRLRSFDHEEHEGTGRQARASQATGFNFLALLFQQVLRSAVGFEREVHNEKGRRSPTERLLPISLFFSPSCTGTFFLPKNRCGFRGKKKTLQKNPHIAHFHCSCSRWFVFPPPVVENERKNRQQPNKGSVSLSTFSPYLQLHRSP